MIPNLSTVINFNQLIYSPRKQNEKKKIQAIYQAAQNTIDHFKKHSFL